MGGYNSGRGGGWGTVEGCASLVLSIDQLMRGSHKVLRRLGVPQPTNDRPLTLGWHTWRWSRSGESEPWAEVEMRLELRANSGTAWLRYDIDHATRPTGPQSYSISMVTTPCPFGGVRWWWLCPATHRQVSKLYLPVSARPWHERPASRECSAPPAPPSRSALPWRHQAEPSARSRSDQGDAVGPFRRKRMHRICAKKKCR
jgi:hypothetical protein